MRTLKKRRPPKPLKYIRPKLTFPDFSIHFDGGCWPNPGGDPTWGIVVYDRTGKEMHTASGMADDKYPRTNNTAEFTGMMMAAKMLETLTGAVSIIGDSQLAIYAMQKTWPMKKSAHLKELAEQCRAEVNRFKGVVWFEWVPREENAKADSLT